MIRLTNAWLAAAALTIAISMPSLANTITFETAPLGHFTAPYIEDGFEVFPLFNSTYVATEGNPGNDLEGTMASGPLPIDNSVIIKRVGGGTFAFNSIDYAAYNSKNRGSQTLILSGYLNNNPLGNEAYTLDNTDVVHHPLGLDWTTEDAHLLAGVKLDVLRIDVNSYFNSDMQYLQAVDNVVLTPTASAGVPEPATLLLLVAGMIFAGSVRHRRNPRKA